MGDGASHNLVASVSWPKAQRAIGIFGSIPAVRAKGAKLARTRLNWANLSGADLTGADLTAARLCGANRLAANLSRVKLIEADLSGAVLGDTIWSDTSLDRAIGLETCEHWQPSTIEFRTLSQPVELPISLSRRVVPWQTGERINR